MQIGPEDAAVHLVAGLEHVVMIAPVDADENETEHIAEKNRNDWTQRHQIGAVRHFQLQHHNGDNDGDNAVAEGFETSLIHAALCLAASNLAATRLPAVAAVAAASVTTAVSAAPT